MPISAAMTMTYDDPITFSGSPLDRVDQQRRDGEWLSAQLMNPSTRLLPMSRLRAMIDLDVSSEIGWRSPVEALDLLEENRPVLLGVQDGIAHFVIEADPRKAPRDATWLSRGKFIDVRSIAPSMPGGDASILAQARSMLDWHQRHQFCAVCGQPSRMESAGYMRQCTDDGCKAQHFPRTDPVTIMLVFSGDNCLLGRQPRFPEGSYSALAGFMEPGESIEECVRREIWEEAGIKVGKVRYVASQPWPFPSSLMIGCFAEAESTEITIDPTELDDAKWFTRDQVIAMIENSESGEGLRMPPALSLAHQLARRWLAGV
jgi:NAD+ diphosphatase